MANHSSPIPNAIEALCRWIDTGDTELGGFSWGKKNLGLTEGSLWEIFELRKNKDWNNPRLRELVSTSRSEADVLAGVKNK